MALTIEERQTHDANKREVFDTMRAYHESELAHKRDAVSMLTTLLLATGAIYGAILTARVAPSVRIAFSGWIEWVPVLVLVTMVVIIVSTTNRKIEEDHRVYEDRGAEYTRACRALGLDQVVDLGGDERGAVKVFPPGGIGKGKGYRHTKGIVRGAGFIVVLLGVLGAFITWSIRVDRMPEGRARQHFEIHVGH